MSGDRLREVCAELVEALDAELDLFETRHSDLIDRARAVLAEAQPQPVEPTQQELEDLAYAFGREYDEGRLLDDEDAAIYARAVLARWGRPAPVPVSVDERPWEREGWCDAEGRCWLFGKIEGDWRLMSATNSGLPNLKYCFSHSLPHWALPVPQEQADYTHNS
jgi:hypothetical protein